MDHNPYHYHTLPNGLRIVCERRPGAAADYFGIAVMTGSRDERPDEFGMAHFVEHTIFKGTGKRRSWHILNRMESVGGELNAFTTKEETYVYSAFPRGNASRAVELIADLVTDSRFPEKQIDLEREVVADEIASYLDSPSEAVYDDFEDLLFAGSGLGHNILGNEDSLRSFTSAGCTGFLRRNYVASNMVAFYSGAMSPYTVFRLVDRYFSSLPEGEVRRADSAIDFNRSFNQQRQLSLHQSHTLVGTIVPGIYSPDTAAISLLTNIIGGPGMNSLLNLNLRERSGLVYTVEASATLYRDCGVWTIYFGCDSHDTDKCLARIRRTVESLASARMSDRRLGLYVRQLAGQMTMARDQRESSIMSAARGTLFHGRALTLDENIERIRAVTPDRLRECAEKLTALSRLTFC